MMPSIEWRAWFTSFPHKAIMTLIQIVCFWMDKAIAELTEHQTEMVLISNSHVSMDKLACM